MLKNLLRKKFSDVESLNAPYEGAKRQSPNNEDFERFITTCKHELKETSQCICFNLEQVNTIITYYGSNNLYYEQTDYYYVIKPKRYIITKLNGKEYRRPITNVIDIREVVLRYE